MLAELYLPKKLLEKLRSHFSKAKRFISHGIAVYSARDPLSWLMPARHSFARYTLGFLTNKGVSVHPNLDCGKTSEVYKSDSLGKVTLFIMHFD